MSLIVEDGTGLSTAEAYISVADATTYHNARGNADWKGAAHVLEAALRKATDYMQQRYRGSWQGYKLVSTQALDWPRSWVEVDGYAVPSNLVPPEVARACAELALRALAGDLLADQEAGAVKAESIGPISVEYTEGGAHAEVRYPAVDQLLAPFITSGSSGVNRRAVRA